MYIYIYRIFIYREREIIYEFNNLNVSTSGIFSIQLSLDYYQGTRVVCMHFNPIFPDVSPAVGTFCWRHVQLRSSWSLRRLFVEGILAEPILPRAKILGAEKNEPKNVYENINLTLGRGDYETMGGVIMKPSYTQKANLKIATPTRPPRTDHGMD